ncbi:MAG: hypothetical protein V1755_12240 [Chloroflexota bacterium]
MASVDGAAGVASFFYPQGIALDGKGTVYVGQQNRARVVSGGQVSTLAGGPVDGFADGPVGTAKFEDVKGVAFHSSGNLYLADGYNRRIRMIAGNQVSTFAGNGQQGFADGPAAAAKFNYPYDVAVDAAGKVYVADPNNHRVRMIASGMVTTLAGDGVPGFADGPIASARFRSPEAVAVDSQGKIYVADGNDHRIRVIAP